MDSKISSIISDFIKTHDLSGVILYGSYARGDQSNSSDLDLLGIKENISNYTNVRVIEGIQLDGWIKTAWQEGCSQM